MSEQRDLDGQETNGSSQAGPSASQPKSSEEENSNSSIHSEKSDEQVDKDTIKEHASYKQVILDVNRCVRRMAHLRAIYGGYHRTNADDSDLDVPVDLTDDFELKSLSDDTASSSAEQDKIAALFKVDPEQFQENLACLITRILMEKPDLHYYQGFHDVALTYVSMLGERDAYKRLSAMVDTHFHTFMRPTVDETRRCLELIPMICGLVDRTVMDFLERSEVGTIFALSWAITWFSHVIPRERDVIRIFEFLEEEDEHMVYYLCASLVLQYKQELLKLEPEMATVLQFLSDLPQRSDLNLDRLIREACSAYYAHSPDKVKRKLEEHRRLESALRRYHENSMSFGLPLPYNLSRLMSPASVLAVLVIAGIAFQVDRWIRNST